jgi:hypothetical protein
VPLRSSRAFAGKRISPGVSGCGRQFYTNIKTQYIKPEMLFFDLSARFIGTAVLNLYGLYYKFLQ